VRHFVAGLVALFAFAAAAGASGSFVIAGIAALAAGSAGGAIVTRSFKDVRSPLSFSRSTVIACAMAAALATLLLARLTVYIVDPSRTPYSVVPVSEWEVRHSCATAYYMASDLVRRVPNLYDLGLYAAPDDDPRLPRKPRTIGIFRVDQYEYPPPFLLVPRALLTLAPDFVHFRMIWYGLNGLVVLAGLLVVAWHLRAAAAGRALLLMPFVLMSIITLNTLQKGNVQLTVIAAGMIAMVLVERKQHAAGGALLAYLTLSKLYPGLLVLYLLARKEWRAVAWVSAGALLLFLATLLDVGWQPFVAFRHQLPGLLSGEAFPAFRNPAAVAINHSIPGLVFKLKLFGLTGLGFGASQLVGTVYMLVAVALTLVVARRPVRDELAPLVWMAILILATLRSPFLPQSYAPFPAIWLLTLLFAVTPPRRWTLTSFLALYLALNIFMTTDSGIDPRIMAIAATIPQALIVALAVFVLRLSLRSTPTPRTVPSYAVTHASASSTPA